MVKDTRSRSSRSLSARNSFLSDIESRLSATGCVNGASKVGGLSRCQDGTIRIVASGKEKTDARGHERRPSLVPPSEGLDACSRTGRVVRADGVDEACRIFL